MGHIRLGSIPKSQKWQSVVAALAEGGGSFPRGITADEVRAIAQKTLAAAERGLHAARSDRGLAYSFLLLSWLASAVRQPNWRAALRERGVKLNADSSMFDLSIELHRAIDKYLATHRLRTDIAEMAQQAAGEALLRVAPPVTLSLFDTAEQALVNSLKKVSTKAGFAELGQSFFGLFLAKFLSFYLSRITPMYLDRGGPYQTGDLTAFNDLLNRHCYQSARIIRDFCGDWYSKALFEGHLDLDHASRFVAVAIRKIQDELGKQRSGS